MHLKNRCQVSYNILILIINLEGILNIYRKNYKSINKLSFGRKIKHNGSIFSLDSVSY